MLQNLIDRLRRTERAVVLDAADWGIPAGAARLLLILPLVAAVGVALAAPFPRLYHFLIDEDSVIEWTQFGAMVLAAIVFAVAGWRAWRLGRLRFAILFALIAVGSVVVAGEEISWGQRILGLATPEILEDINHQGETNIHNIRVVQHAFSFGELVAGLYGFAVPILVAAFALRNRLLGRLDRLLVPPLCLASLFFLPFAYRSFRAIFLADAGTRITQYGELPELTFYLGILITGVLISRRLGRAASSDPA